MDKNLSNLIYTLTKIDNPHVMYDFLVGLFTEKELEEIPTRLEIIKRLKRNVPQRKIAEELGVGIATVTRGSKQLHMERFKQI